MSAQLIPAEKVERHDELMRQFAVGLLGMCVALWRIREEKTYEAVGLDSFAAFLRKHSITESSGRLYANSGAIFLELQKSGHAQRVVQIDLLKPVALLLNTKKQPVDTQRRVIERQAHIIRTAITEADRGQEPLTQKVVSRVAQRFGIKPVSEYRAEKRARAAREAMAQRDEAEIRARMKQDVELALTTIVAYRRTGYELVQEIGPAEKWLGFCDALQILVDARDA